MYQLKWDNFKPPSSAHCFCPVCHSVLLSETLTLLITFEQWVLEIWYFTCRLNILWKYFMRQAFPWIPTIFTLWTLPLSLTYFLKTFGLAKNFWTVSARVYTFHINVSRGKAFPWVPTFFILWPWPWSPTNFLKILTLLITFQQLVLELWYFTWIFYETRPSHGNQQFWPCDLNLNDWPSF